MDTREDIVIGSVNVANAIKRRSSVIKDVRAHYEFDQVY